MPIVIYKLYRYITLQIHKAIIYCTIIKFRSIQDHIFKNSLFYINNHEKCSSIFITKNGVLKCVIGMSYTKVKNTI